MHAVFHCRSLELEVDDDVSQPVRSSRFKARDVVIIFADMTSNYRKEKRNYVNFLKSLHLEPINKVLLKNDAILKDVRFWAITKSLRDILYSEALLKISSIHLNKKYPNILDIK